MNEQQLARNKASLQRKAVNQNGNFMINTVWAVVHEGRIEPLQQITAPEGTRVLVTLLLEDEADFWQSASPASLNKVWDNTEDDRYAALLDA